jgi:hypothetical protein
LLVVLRPESMSSLDAAWLLVFLGKLICGMDTQPFRVWMRFSNAEAPTPV